MTERNPYLQAESAAQFVLSQTGLRPTIGLVLGSGLGEFVGERAQPRPQHQPNRGP